MSGSSELPASPEEVPADVRAEVDLTLARFSLNVPSEDLPQVVAACRLIRALAARLGAVPEIDAVAPPSTVGPGAG